MSLSQLEKFKKHELLALFLKAMPRFGEQSAEGLHSVLSCHQDGSSDWMGNHVEGIQETRRSVFPHFGLCEDGASPTRSKGHPTGPAAR